MNKEGRPADPDVGGHGPPYSSSKLRGQELRPDVKSLHNQVGRAVPPRNAGPQAAPRAYCFFCSSFGNTFTTAQCSKSKYFLATLSTSSALTSRILLMYMGS